MTDITDEKKTLYFSTSKEIPGLRVQDLEYEPDMNAKSIPHRILPSLGIGRRDTHYPLINTQVGEVIIRQQNDVVRDGIFKLLGTVSPFAFEMATVDILEAAYKGNGVQTPRTGDGGIDGIIYCKEPYKQTYLIQCKQYANPVSTDEIEAFWFDCEIWSEEHYPDVECIFVALNGYTQGARDKGDNLGITMITGHELAEIALKNSICIEKVDFPLLDKRYWEEMSMSDKLALMPHQHIHSWKLDNTPFPGIAIFDDVGTGKTISALNIVNKHIEKKTTPVLIIIPPALFGKWQAEVKKWCGKSVHFSTIRNGKISIRNGVNLLSHGALQTQKITESPKIGLLIIDEAHHFRNPETISSKCAFDICRSSEKRIIMTATPLQNGVDDLVTILNLVLCDFQSSVVNAVVTESLGTSNGEILYPLITRCILKNNDNKRIINNHKVRMSEKEKQYHLELINSYKGKQLSKIMIMKMAASSMATIKKFTGHDIEIKDSKIEYTASMINDFCKNGRKVIVFSEYIETARALSSKLEDHLIGLITGETPPDSRTAFLTGLEYSQGGVIVMTDVGGEGLDMQFVDAVVNHDLPWNPMILEQRIGRLDRIGRDERNVEVHNIILEDSLDHHISHILLEKEKLTSKFGGYGISVDIEKDGLIADTAFNFKSLTSEVFQNDAIGCSTRNLEYLNKKIQHLESILEDLV